MKLLVVAGLLVLVVWADVGEGHRVKGEILKTKESARLVPGGPKYVFSSLNYPSPSPEDLLQTWDFETHPDSRIRIQCMEIRLPYRIPGKCEPDYTMKVDDGGEIQDICGTKYDYSSLSKTNRVRVTLTAGYAGMNFLNCTAQGRVMGPDGEVTEKPKSNRPAYMEIESEEIDSSEHGVAPGKKRPTCDCGRANKKNSRIVGGRQAVVNEYPHIVGLVLEYDFNQVFCGGSIISDKHVLTAAHCTRDMEKNRAPLWVRIGDHDFTDDNSSKHTQLIRVVQIIEHDRFNRVVPLIFDVSLLVLEKDIKFTQYIAPICLPKPGQRMNLDNKYVKIMGWGRVSHYGQQSTVLKTAQVRVVPEEQCFGEITEDGSRLCTYARNRSTCMGDSGGPVAWLDPETNRYTLVGLVSYGSLCGGQWPMVSADVTSFIDWVLHFVKASRPSARTCSKP